SADLQGPRFIILSLAGSAGSARPATKTTTAAATSAWAGTGAAAHVGLRLLRQQTFTLQLLAGQLAGPANRLGLLARLLLRGLFVVDAKLHLAEDPLALHLLFERLEGLINIVVANENLHEASFIGWQSGNLGTAGDGQNGLNPASGARMYQIKPE